MLKTAELGRSEHAKYLGDGVYADIQAGMIRLTTENGIEVTNMIYLVEPEVFEALKKWESNLRGADHG